MIMDIIIVIILMGFTLLFTASEMAFIASNKLFVLVRSQKDNKYKVLYRLLIKPEIYLYSVLVGTNLAIAAMTTLSEELIFPGNEVGASLYFSLLLSIIILIVGEIIPKTITKESPERYAVIYAPLIKFFYYIFYPMILLSTAFSELILILTNIKSKGIRRLTLSKSDLEFFVKGGFEGENISVHENKLISGIFDFNDKNAGDVLIPRTDIVMLRSDDDFVSAKAHLMEEKKIFTRLPVYHENPDTVIGIVNINDLIMLQSGKVRDIMEKPHFAPETVSLGNLLVEMKSKNIHMTVIVDEYGQLSGIVTLEDIIEELIGDISDEYDKDDGIDWRKGKMIIDGDRKIEDINERGFVFLQESNYYETVSGYVMYKLGRIPDEGDIINIDENTSLRIMRMIENRIETVEIEQRKKNNANQ